MTHHAFVLLSLANMKAYAAARKAARVYSTNDKTQQRLGVVISRMEKLAKAQKEQS